MERLPAVPDVTVERALPGRPDTWRGRADRRPVDVTVVTLPPDPAVRRAALAALTPLVADGAGALPRGRAATLCRDGVAFVADACDGSALPRTLAVRTARTAGTAAAQALCELHGRGLTWGGSAAEMLMTGDTVLLPYDGIIRRRVAGTIGTVGADLIALVSALADRCDDPGLAALVAHPPTDARALHRALRRVGRARVLRSAPSRRWAWVPAAVVAVAAAAAVGWWSARPPHAVGAPLAPVSADWTATVHGLDAARAAALAGRGTLAAADASDSAAGRIDATTRAALVSRHVTALAPQPMLLRVIPVRVTPQTATLRVTDTLAAYDYRDAAGQVVARVPARGPRIWTVTLRRTTTTGWRFEQVS